jgi:hypothetical protein
LFILSNFINKQFDTQQLNIINFLSITLPGLSLFFFLLYADNKIKIDEKNRFAPSKLLPMVSFWLILGSILYSLLMSIVYIHGQSLTDKFERQEKFAIYYKKTSLDDKQSAEKRLNAASEYYIHYGEDINYLDENNQKKLYLPDKSANKERMKVVKTKKESRTLKTFILSSSLISLLTGLIVTIFYLRHRKTKKLRQSFSIEGMNG